MNGKDLLHGMNYVEDKFIDEAQQPVRRTGRPWVRVVSTAACLGVVIFGAVAVSGGLMPKQESTGQSVTDHFYFQDGILEVGTDSVTNTNQEIAADMPQVETPSLIPEKEWSASESKAENDIRGMTAYYFKTGSPAEPVKPTVTVLRSRTQLDAFLTGRKPEAMLETCEAYDDTWFADNVLLLVQLDENSGSVRHEVQRLYRDEQGQWLLQIRKQVPEMGTCDMARWQLLVEVPAGSIGPDETVTVTFQ